MPYNYVVVVIAIPYPRFGVLSSVVPRDDVAYHITMSQLVTYRFAHALTSQKCCLSCWEIKGNWCIANIYIMCLNFCAR